jgi:putative hydrolase of the HAD superfamily
VKTLFLDAGGVLVWPNWARVGETLARHGITVSAESLAKAEPFVRFEIDQAIPHGHSTDTQRAWRYMDRVLETAGVVLGEASAAAVRELRAYHEDHNLWEVVPDDVGPALDRLSSAGLKLVVVSNANGVLHRLFDRVGLTRYFHCICDSFVDGVEKPDPRFFRIAVDRAGADPASTMHVGDLYHVDVLGARAAGLQAMLIDPLGLYEGYDVERVRTLDELAGRFSAG